MTKKNLKENDVADIACLKFDALTLWYIHKSRLNCSEELPQKTVLAL